MNSLSSITIDGTPIAVTPLTVWLDDLRAKIRNDWDLAIAITGIERSGKTTCSLQLAMLLDDTFPINDIASRIAGNTTEYISLANTTPPYSAIVLDEAFDGAFNRDAMMKTNKFWVKFLGQTAVKNLILLMNFPRFHNIDPYLRDHRMTHWIKVEQRGLAIVRTPIRYDFNDTSYWKPQIALRYDALPPLIQKQYKIWKDAHIEKIMKELTNPEKKPKKEVDIS